MTSPTESNQATLRPPSDIGIAESFEYCRTLTKAQAKNFFYGMMLTPEPKRSAMYAVYAWMRAVDDLADEQDETDADPTAHADTKKVRLEAFRSRTHREIAGDFVSARKSSAGIEGEAFDKMWPAVGQTFRQYHVATGDLDAMIDGQLLDQTCTRYETFDQLYDYCYKVASVVGLVCIAVWGYDGDEKARMLAEKRGIALQLTNVLRDLVEDAHRDRVYLPSEDLNKFGFDADSFARWLRDPGIETAGDFSGLMTMQIDRAKKYYSESATLESHLPRNCRPTCWAMMRIYRRLLDKIEANPNRVLTQRVRLSKTQKLSIAFAAMIRKIRL